MIVCLCAAGWDRWFAKARVLDLNVEQNKRRRADGRRRRFWISYGARTAQLIPKDGSDATLARFACGRRQARRRSEGPAAWMLGCAKASGSNGSANLVRRPYEKNEKPPWMPFQAGHLGRDRPCRRGAAANLGRSRQAGAPRVDSPLPPRGAVDSRPGRGRGRGTSCSGAASERGASYRMFESKASAPRRRNCR